MRHVGHQALHQIIRRLLLQNIHQDLWPTPFRTALLNKVGLECSPFFTNLFFSKYFSRFCNVFNCTERTDLSRLSGSRSCWFKKAALHYSSSINLSVLSVVYFLWLYCNVLVSYQFNFCLVWRAIRIEKNRFLGTCQLKHISVRIKHTSWNVTTETHIIQSGLNTPAETWQLKHISVKTELHRLSDTRQQKHMF